MAFPSIIFSIPVGILADRYGRRKVLAPSLFLFGIAGVSCAFISDFNFLLIMRFFQGIGAVSLLSISLTVIGDIYSGKDRTAAMSYNGSVINVALAIFPATGGAMAIFGWNYPFFLPIVAIPIGLLVLFSLKNPEPKDNQNIKEYLGNAWTIVKNRRVIGLLFASVFTFIVFYGAFMTFFPVLLGYSFGASSLIIGLIITCFSITGAVAALQVGKISRVYPVKRIIALAFFLYALAFVIIPLASSIWLLLIPVVIFGIGHGLNEPSIHTLLAECAPKEHRAVLMSLNWLVVRTGITLGPILLGAFYGLGGVATVFFAGACLSIVMVGLAFIMIK